MSLFRNDPTPGKLTNEDKANMLAAFVAFMLVAMTGAAFLTAADLIGPVNLGFLDTPLSLFTGALLIYVRSPGNDDAEPSEEDKA